MSKITFEERIQISNLLALKMGVRAIADCLGRSPSSISTELRRQGMSLKSYSPIKAQQHSNLRKGASKRAYKVHGALQACIELLLLEKRFSPQQICAHLKRLYPENQYLHLCHETLYQYIYRSGLRSIYARCLRRRRKKRRKRGRIPKQGFIRDYLSISQRPRQVQEREEGGHWESDLVIGKNRKSAIGTLVERTSRYTIIVPLLNGRKSLETVQSFHNSLLAIPKLLKKTMTHDQGSELFYHKNLAELSGMSIFFAHKGSPWERGTNENTNGLIRDFFPKGTDFSNISVDELKKVERLLNERPRKVLNYRTPKEVLMKMSKKPDARLSDCIK
jgi:transposase, IS30 family